MVVCIFVVCICMYVCMYICMYVWMDACMYVRSNSQGDRARDLQRRHLYESRELLLVRMCAYMDVCNSVCMHVCSYSINMILTVGKYVCVCM